MGDKTNRDISFDDAARVVDLWASMGLVNIRFSGGEPTLWKGLGRLVSHTRARDVQRIAVSSNGSASTEYYQQLVEAGVNDFSISLDSCCASTGNEMAGRSGVWDKIIGNIRTLAEITYVTVGVVLTDRNTREVNKIVRFASALGVADIRLITASQTESRALCPVDDVDKNTLAKHPILAYRLQNRRKGRGIRGLTDKDNDRCPLVLDDMMVAYGKHYPCIIYYRQRGAAIGEVGPTMRRERLAWSRTHNIHTDPICSGNCLDVCVDYNNRVRELQPNE
jgi:molybdenum cofactor biosynthesis enzyme MoaA